MKPRDQCFFLGVLAVVVAGWKIPEIVSTIEKTKLEKLRGDERVALVETIGKNVERDRRRQVRPRPKGEE